MVDPNTAPDSLADAAIQDAVEAARRMGMAQIGESAETSQMDGSAARDMIMHSIDEYQSLETLPENIIVNFEDRTAPDPHDYINDEIIIKQQGSFWGAHKSSWGGKEYVFVGYTVHDEQAGKFISRRGANGTKDLATGVIEYSLSGKDYKPAHKMTPEDRAAAEAEFVVLTQEFGKVLPPVEAK